MSLLTSLQIGNRALSVASAGVNVTTQNVSNVNTPGYARRKLQQGTLAPVRQGTLLVGQGVQATGIHRASDRLLGARFAEANGEAACASSMQSAMKVTESYFDEAQSTGIVQAYDEIFDAMGAADADPGDTSLRQGVISALDTFAQVISRTAQGLDATVEGLDDQITAGLGSVNDQLAQVAALNKAIAGAGGSAPDYEDQRDALIGTLSEQIGTTVEYRADGQAVLYLGGHAVVAGDHARTLTAGTDSSGAPTVLLSADNATLDVTEAVGGTVGGLVAARDTTQGYLDHLDTFAQTFATTMNTQHALGYTEGGAAGGDVFTVSATSAGAASSLGVDAGLKLDPTLLALASDPSLGTSDAGNLDALRALETDTSTFGMTGHDVLSELVTTVGTDVKAAGDEADATSALLSDVQTVRDSVSGVSTDEEAAQLLQYQAAYRAASKVIATVNDMLGDLMNMAR